MKILFVLEKLPEDLNNGVSIALYYRIRELSKRIDTYVSVCEPASDKASEMFPDVSIWHYPLLAEFSRIKQICRFLNGTPTYATREFSTEVLTSFAQWVRMSRFSVVYVMTEALLPIIEHISSGNQKTVAWINDSTSLSLRDELHFNIYSNPIRRALIRLNLILSERFEQRHLPRYSLCQVVSIVDEKHLKNISSEIKTAVVPLGARLPLKPRSEEPELQSDAKEHFVLMAGRLSGGNLKYAEMFVKHIWRSVNARHPSVKLKIISPESPRTFLESNLRYNVSICENVDQEHLDVLYETAICVVSPVRKTAGMLNKVLEGMAHGKAVVGFPWNFVSIGRAIDGEHFISAEDDRNFADKISHIIKDLSCARRIGEKARRLIESEYSWAKVSDDYITKVTQLMIEGDDAQPIKS